MALETVPDISVIVPHLNDAKRLAACLDALAAQTHPAERIEIIVVDNGSREFPSAVVGRFANARLIEEPTPGPGPARNRGAAASRAPILAFTDSDCIPEPDWVARILSRFAADPCLEIIGGEIRIMVERPGHPTPAEAFELLYAFRQEMQIARHHFSATANLAVRRAVLARVGPFAGIDTTEDVDWGQRAARLGHWTRYAPEVVVHHPARRTMQALQAQWNRHISHYYRRMAHGPGGRTKWFVTACAMPLSPIVEIPRILATPRVSSLRERWLIFRGLFGIRLYRGRRMLQLLIDADTRSASSHWNRK